MFDNVGRILKVFALIFMILGIIGSIGGGGTCIVTGAVGWGVVVIIGGIFLSYLSSMMIAGYGQLIENTDSIRESVNSLNLKMRTIIDKTIEKNTVSKVPDPTSSPANKDSASKSYSASESPASTATVSLSGKIVCGRCGAANASNATKCLKCGMPFLTC